MTERGMIRYNDEESDNGFFIFAFCLLFGSGFVVGGGVVLPIQKGFMSFNQRFKKWTAVLSAFFFLSAQPVWAAPVLSEEYLSEEEPQGFVGAEQAEQSFQNQLNEVQSVDQAFNGPTNLTSSEEVSSEPSILVKFQQTGETTTDEVSDLALLATTPTPLPQAEPVAMEMSEPEEEQPVTLETASEESDEPQPVAMAETEEETDQVLTNNNEESASTAVIEFAAAEAETSDSQTSSSDSNLTVENLVSEEPVLLASLSVMSAPSVMPEAEATEEVLSDAVAKSVSQQTESAVATELAALMGVSSVGTAASSSSSVGVAESSIMGALPEGSSTSQSFLQEDPVIASVPFSPVLFDATIDPTKLFGSTGGFSRVGKILDAFKQFISDLTAAPNGQTVPNGFGEAFETLKDADEIFALISFILATYFDIDIEPGALGEILLNGTTEKGVQLFKSAGILFGVFIATAFFLFGDKISLSDFEEGSYSVSIPLFFPDYVSIAFAEAFFDTTGLSVAEKKELGRSLFVSSFSELATIFVEAQVSNGGFIFNPGKMSDIKAFFADEKRFLKFSSESFKVSVTFIEAEIHESLGEGLPAVLTIQFSEEFLNTLIKTAKETIRANLGEILKFLRGFGQITGVGPNAPFFYMAGLFTVNLGKGVTEGVAAGNATSLNMLFDLLFSFLQLFAVPLSDQIPNGDTMSLNSDNPYYKNVINAMFSNSLESFKEIDQRRKDYQTLINKIQPVTVTTAAPITPTVTEVKDPSQKKIEQFKKERATEYREGSFQKQQRQQRQRAVK